MATWDRQPNESTPAYEAASLYFQLGAGRDVRTVAQKLHKSVTIVGRWSSRWSWVSRAADYDAHLAAVAQQAAEQVTASQAIDWAARRADQREREWTMAEQLMDRAVQMLRFPLQRVSQQTGDDGRALTIIEPVRWSLADVPRIAEAAAKLARLAAEMETDRLRLEAVDVTKLSTDELIALRDQLRQPR